MLELITCIAVVIIATIMVVERMPIVNRVRVRIKQFLKNTAFKLRTIRNKVRLKFKK